MMMSKQLYKMTIYGRTALENNLLKEEDIEFKHIGLFLDNRSTYNWNDSFMEHLKVISIDTVNIQDKSFYRYPKLTLPRNKMQILSDKYNTKIVRNPDKADYKIISEKLLETFLNRTWQCGHDCDVLIGLYKMFQNSILVENSAKEKINDFMKNNSDCALILESDFYYNSSFSNNSNISTLLNASEKYMNDLRNADTRYAHYVKKENMDHYLDIIKSDNLLIDSDLSKICTEDSVTLDDESYRRLEEMLKSSDKENQKMALETMANCNYETSKSYIALLLYFYSDDIKYCGIWNSVNVKALKKEFTNYIFQPDFYRTWAYDTLVKKLTEDDALTEFTVSEITKNVFDKVLKTTFGVNSNSVFEISISSIKLKEKYKDKIKAQYPYANKSQALYQSMQADDLPF